MPLFMDIYGHIKRLTADAVANARATGLKTPPQCGITHLRGWFAETVGQVFCLVEELHNDTTCGMHWDS